MVNTQASTIPVTRFNLNHVERKQRFEVWRETMADASMEIELPDKAQGEAFSIDLTAFHLSNMMLVSAHSSAQFQNRTNKLIAKDGLEHFLVQLYLQGTASVQSARRSDATARAGDIILVDLARPSAGFVDHYSNLNMVIPRHVLLARCPNIERCHGAVLSRDSIFGRLLGEHILSLYRSMPEMTADASAAVAEGVANLVGSYFSQEMPCEERSASLQAANYQTVRQYILHNLEVPDLSPEMIAAHFRMSRSYLYRLFDKDGGVARFIQEQRLLKAHKMLRSRTHRYKNVREIAYALGFNSDSHFCHSFQRYFGERPSDVRQQQVVPKAVSGESASVEQRFVEWVNNLC